MGDLGGKRRESIRKSKGESCRWKAGREGLMGRKNQPKKVREVTGRLLRGPPKSKREALAKI
jgi:hypothetical protein